MERAGVPVAAIVPLRDLDAVDPAQLVEQRIAAIRAIARSGQRIRERYGPVDAAELVREGREERQRRISP